MNYWQIALAIIGFKIYSNKYFNPNIKYFLAPPDYYDINDITKDKKNTTSNMKFSFKTTYRFLC